MGDSHDAYDDRGEVDVFLKQLSDDWQNEEREGVAHSYLHKNNASQVSGSCDFVL